MLSFVMPTINGFHRVNLVCSWLHYQNFEGTLIVVDGSQKKHTQLEEAWSFVTYIHIPGCSSPSAQYQGFQSVKTPYACLIGDDDLPILNGCDKCIDFLSENSDYDAVHGSISFFDFEKTQCIFEKKAKLNYWYCVKTYFSGRYDKHSDYSADAYLERLNEFHTNYIVSLFCIARTSLAKTANNEIINAMEDVHMSEILSSFGYILTAKIKKVPDLYLMRGLGSHRPNASTAALRHTKLDIESANKYTLDYLSFLRLDERYMTTCLALLVDIRLKGFLKSSPLSPKRMKTLSSYFVQQTRRLALSISLSNLVKFSFIYWLKKKRSL